MKHIKLFENFTEDHNELTKAEKLLNATSRAEYYVLDIKDLPKNYSDSVFIYVPKTKTFHMMDKNLEMDDEDIVSLRVGISSGGKTKGKAYVEEGVISTTDPQFFYNLIELERLEENGISEEVREWFEEEVNGTDDTWEEIIKRSRTEGPELNDKDMKILGISEEKFKGAQAGKGYNV
jgi:hypothetical protein